MDRKSVLRAQRRNEHSADQLRSRVETESAQCAVCGCTIAGTLPGKCPQCGVEFAFDGAASSTLLALPDMRYPNAYVWLLFVSALDVILTMLVLFVFEGREVNPVAAAVINALGFGWAIVFKFASILLVILLCEAIGRHDDKWGRSVGGIAVGLNTCAVLYTFTLLFLGGPTDLIKVLPS